MKKTLGVIIMACALCLGLLAACGGSSQSAPASSTSDSASSVSAAGNESASTATKKVVCTIFPAYDWAREVIGDAADDYELTLLLDEGADLHSYQPTVEDIAKISDCDLFVYAGGESDEWVEDALSQAKNPDMQTINMLEAIGDAAVEEEVVEGMQEDEHEHGDADHDEGADHEGDAEEHDHDAEAEEHDHDHEGEPEYDEHVWLSLVNAQALVNQIAEKLAALDSGNADAIKANAKAYNAKLAELDGQYRSAVDGASVKTVLFADRFPFRYLVDDYGLSYYAAFVGCSAETEASFETVAFLAKKVDELNLPVVYTIENSDQKIAKTVVENTQAKNQEIVVMDSLQSTAADDVANGKTYLSAMADNLDALKKGIA